MSDDTMNDHQMNDESNDDKMNDVAADKTVQSAEQLSPQAAQSKKSSTKATGKKVKSSHHSTQEARGKNSSTKSTDKKTMPSQRANDVLSEPTISTHPTGTNPVVTDETYGVLREDNRIVMRHQIALNLDSFRAAPDDFDPHPKREYSKLAMATVPFFSVVIPNYNGMRFLPTLMAALQAQSFGDFELILADDGSTDHSVAFVEEHYPSVRIIVNRRNVGFVQSCNLAADAAHGRYIVLLNNDTEPESTWLAELAQAIVAAPQAAIIASKLLLFDNRTQIHTTGDLLGVDGIPQNRGVWEEDRGQYDGDLQIFSGTGGGSAFRREVWQQLGGFDNDFWMYMEDVDLGFRAQLAGYDVIFAPKARIYHHLSATGGGTMASYFVGRNTIWMIAKNMPTSLLLRHWPAIVNAQLQIALDALRNIRGEAARARLWGQLAGLWGVPRQLAKRRTIQQRRRLDDELLSSRFGKI